MHCLQYSETKFFSYLQKGGMKSLQQSQHQEQAVTTDSFYDLIQKQKDKEEKEEGRDNQEHIFVNLV